MPNGVMNYGKGRFAEWCELKGASDAIVVVLLQATGLQTDAVLQDYSNLAALLAATNDEATFTNYSRKVFTSGITVTVSTVNNNVVVNPGNMTWSAAGGALNNNLGKLITAWRPDSGATDSQIVPMTFHDFTATTTGSDLLATISASGLATAA